MRNILKLTKSVVVLLIVVLIFQSCSTGYQASRYSHLKYVKRDHKIIMEHDNKAGQAKLEKLPAHADKIAIPDANDYTSLVPPVTKPVGKSQHGHTVMDGTAPEETPFSLAKSTFKNGIGQSTITKGSEWIAAFKPAANDLIYDQDKLLLLWLILAGAAVVFGLLAAVAWPFGILATIAAIAAIVFFILWIVNIARS
ncbi:MAG: hypothetical protein KBF32_05450 [Chitinophagales bacterium]|nr:hypothetical protein [Chitinophagales bacterium]